MKRRTAAELGGNRGTNLMGINILFYSFNLGYGAVARLFEARCAAGPPNRCDNYTSPYYQSQKPLLTLTFGGMWRWRRVAVARVFALVVRCSDMMLFVYSRVGKNRDTRGSPRREPGQAAPPTT